MNDYGSTLKEKRPFELHEIDAYTQPLSELVKRLETDQTRGLSRKDAEERLQLIGPNLIPKIKLSFYRTYIAPLTNWLIVIYLVISTILAFLAFFVFPEVWMQVVLWLSIIAINAFIAIVQQVRAQTKLESLILLSAPKANVIREGTLMEISAECIVPGDVINLEQGDRVPADARIIVASNLRVGEASLTGESGEVDKFESDIPVEKNTPISSRKNMVFLGTYVTVGSARALVVKTGSETQLGMVSKGVEEHSTGEVLLLQKINTVARYLGFGVLIYISLSLTYDMISLYLSDQILNTYLVAKTVVNCLVTSMSIMPINIPLLTTIILITGILAMARHQVVIRNMNAIENLGRVSVICSDKTGTITKNEMTVKWISLQTVDLEDRLYGVSGVGFQHLGEIKKIDLTQNLEELVKKDQAFEGEIEAEIKPETPLEYLLVSGLLNNDSTVVEDKTEVSGKKEEVVYKALGDTTDASILVLFGKSKLDENEYRSRFEAICSYPFDSKLKRMTKVFKDTGKDKYAVFTKGATEVVLPLCDAVCKEDLITEVNTLNEEGRSLINKRVDLFAKSEYRVISFGFRYLDKFPGKSKTERAFFEDNLTYLGFVSITDPPRDGVREAVFEAKDAGIKSIMITGDSLETARSIAHQVGIAQQDDLAVEGCEIESLRDEEFLNVSVFARVSPEHKVIIIDRYKQQNRAVAMTGDGVNDTLALSGADVGIAMGITGTDVAKEAADMIITDDSFSSIVTGIREGRGVFHKIRAVVFFYIAVNVAEALVFFGASFIPGLDLLNTWQRLYIVLPHSLPPLSLIIDRLSRDVMKEKPRDRESLSKHQRIAFIILSMSLAFVFFIAYFGASSGMIPVVEENKMGVAPTFSPYDSYNPVDWTQAKARTMLLSVIFVAECTLIISLRRVNKSFHKIILEDNYWKVWLFILLVPLVHFALMYIPEIQLFVAQAVGINLEIIQLTWLDWTIAIALGLIPILLLEYTKTLLRKHGLLL